MKAAMSPNPCNATQAIGAGTQARLTLPSAHKRVRVAPRGASPPLDPAWAPAAKRRLTNWIPQVLHVDPDGAAGLALGVLLAPHARVTSVSTLADARRMLRQELYSLVVLDHEAFKEEAESLVAALAGAPLLIYSATQPEWRDPVGLFLSKARTSQRLLWTTISSLLGVDQQSGSGN